MSVSNVTKMVCSVGLMGHCSVAHGVLEAD